MEDLLADERPDQEAAFADQEDLGKRRMLLRAAPKALGERERRILIAWRLNDQPEPLESLRRSRSGPRLDGPVLVAGPVCAAAI